jgi:hypothetical protein
VHDTTQSMDLLRREELLEHRKGQRSISAPHRVVDAASEERAVDDGELGVPDQWQVSSSTEEPQFALDTECRVRTKTAIRSNGILPMLIVPKCPVVDSFRSCSRLTWHTCRRE